VAKVAVVDHHEVAKHVPANKRDDGRLLRSEVGSDHEVEVDRGQSRTWEAETRRVLSLRLDAAHPSHVDDSDGRNFELGDHRLIDSTHACAGVDEAQACNRGRNRRLPLPAELLREHRVDSDRHRKHGPGALKAIGARLASGVQDHHVVNRHRLGMGAEETEGENRNVGHRLLLKDLLDEE
jgi:hypothetical protein